MSEELKIDIEFARRDDCLTRMVPSDLRMLVSERDQLRAELASVKAGQGGAEPKTMGGSEYIYREALRQLREALEPEDWMGEISMHAFIDSALAGNSPPSDPGTVAVPVELFKKSIRDFDACQRVIHYAGGFDPAYANDAQECLQELRALLAQSQEVQ